MIRPTAKMQPVPQLVTRLPGPRAAAWIARDDQVLSPSYTRDYPLVVERGRGCVIEDVDGNRLLDLTSGIAVAATGHAHPEVVAAIADQAAKLIHMSGTDFYYAAEIELAERLAALVPGDAPKRMFFANSGTESIEAALKLARYHTKRPRIISFYGAFHGRTYGALSISGSKAVHQAGFGPMLPGVHRLPFNCDRPAFETLFRTVAPPQEVAAIFVEPIQGEGGYQVADRQFLTMLRAVCDEHGILLVADEIQSGIGRTGRMFACEHFGIAPDILCMAKGLASGMPLGAMVASSDIMDWLPGSHASTFGGNPVACRAALVTLELVVDQYLDNARARGQQLRQRLLALESAVDCVARPRGLGLMQAVDIVRDGQPDSGRRDAILQDAFQRGLILLGCGQAGIRFCPALCITSQEIDTAIDFLHEVCRAAA